MKSEALGPTPRTLNCETWLDPSRTHVVEAMAMRPSVHLGGWPGGWRVVV
jgi:hypothetical protein